MAIKCPKCNADNPDTQRFCGDCAAPLKSLNETATPKTLTLGTPLDRFQIIGMDIGKIIDEKYKLIEEVGRGGMGVVYKTEQIKEIKRIVALKIIKPGMDSREVIARFESEKQALALMNHPNIAQVYDSGLTEHAYPYFVMEYVPGRPITGYCDDKQMTIDERLRLFEYVCGAIQHAHFRGIIHRDIKPSNILVAYQDDRHIPKIIDFGLAKALTGPGLTEKTVNTLHGVGVGTPIYMSPEQAELTGYNVDTRTDIYSLGVLLYELLVGCTPFEIAEPERAGVMEVLRIIREVDPQKPSIRFSSLDAASTEITEKRKTNPVEMMKKLKGDLDIIVMKAIGKDPERRYQNVSSLSEDVSRLLLNQPIIARPPSAIYQLRKLVARHKTLAWSITAIFVLLLGFAIMMTIQSARIVQERDRALEAENLEMEQRKKASQAQLNERKQRLIAEERLKQSREAEQRALAEAERANLEAQIAKDVQETLSKLFYIWSDVVSRNPNKYAGTTVLEHIDKLAQMVRSNPHKKPEIQARLMETVAQIHLQKGFSDQYVQVMTNTLKNLRQDLGADNVILVHY